MSNPMERLEQAETYLEHGQAQLARAEGMNDAQSFERAALSLSAQANFMAATTVIDLAQYRDFLEDE